MRPIPEWSAAEIPQRLFARDCSVVEVLESLLARIQATRSLNTFISIDAKLASARASALQARLDKGERLPLHGVPLIIKDNIDAAGFETTCGTPALRGQRPPGNATVVQRLVDAGAFVVGKANLHELAGGVTNSNALFGAVRNPYRPTMISGGSSGGTAAAIAARQVPAGLASDTGGSARIPASLCGVCGFRPSTGRFPSAGVLVLSQTRDTVGLMARTVEDIELMDQAIVGYAGGATVDVSGLRIGLPRQPFFNELDPDVAAAMDELVQLLQEHGAQTVEVDATDIRALNGACAEGIVGAEVRAGLELYLRERGVTRTATEVIEAIATPGLRERFAALLKRESDVPLYRHLVDEVRPNLQRAYEALFAVQRIDMLLYPTTPATARPIGEDEQIVLNGRSVSTFRTYARNTDPGANAGQPSLTLPVRLSSEGLPVGASIESTRGSDARLLAIGKAIQALLPPFPPPAE